MFQIEDLIRACKLDKAQIEKYILPKYQQEPAVQAEVRQWYFGLTDQMEEEKLSEKGHLITLANKIDEVLDFHLYLMNNLKEVVYQSKFEKIVPLIQELRAKQPSDGLSDLHLALNAVYGFVILRMKGSQVSESTAKAIGQFVEWFNALSAKFKDYETGNLKLDL